MTDGAYCSYVCCMVVDLKTSARRIVEQILTHLGLPSEPVRADPAQPPPASAANLFMATLA